MGFKNLTIFFREVKCSLWITTAYSLITFNYLEKSSPVANHRVVNEEASKCIFISQSFFCLTTTISFGIRDHQTSREAFLLIKTFFYYYNENCNLFTVKSVEENSACWLMWTKNISQIIRLVFDIEYLKLLSWAHRKENYYQLFASESRDMIVIDFLKHLFWKDIIMNKEHMNIALKYCIFII